MMSINNAGLAIRHLQRVEAFFDTLISFAPSGTKRKTDAAKLRRFYINSAKNQPFSLILAKQSLQ